MCTSGTVLVTDRKMKLQNWDYCLYEINRVGIIQIVQELLEAWIQIVLRR